MDASRQGIRTEPGEWGRKTLPVGLGETWCEDLPGDWVQDTNHVVLHCRIHLGDAVYETRDEWAIRRDSPWELTLLARALEGWRMEGFYGWRDLTWAGSPHYNFRVFLVSAPPDCDPTGRWTVVHREQHMQNQSDSAP